MGIKLSRAVTRPFKNYNVEHRAERILERRQEQVHPSPRYPSEATKQNELAAKQLGAASAEAQHYHSKLHAKHEELNERLKSMYVQSVGENRPVVGTSNVQKKLPENRGKVTDTEYGYQEPAVAPRKGRVTIKQALELIGSHYVDKKQCDAEALAKQYKLDLRETQQLLKYFQSYHLAMPQKDSSRMPAAPAGPPGVQLQLPPSKQE